MSEQSAWEWIASNMFNYYWTPVPDVVRSVLKVHPMVGCYQGNLITRKSAEYAQETVAWLNRERKM